MPDPVADDFAAIAARWQEIRAEEAAAKPVCAACDGVGWVRSSAVAYATVFIVCPDCRNALDKPQPQ